MGYGVRRDWDWDWGVFIVALLVFALLASIGCAVWYAWQHPCVKWEERTATCGGGTYCTMWDAKHNCLIWSRRPEYPCTQKVCTQRGDREEMKAWDAVGE
jgi:hypothetical protein